MEGDNLVTTAQQPPQHIIGYPIVLYAQNVQPCIEPQPCVCENSNDHRQMEEDASSLEQESVHKPGCHECCIQNKVSVSCIFLATFLLFGLFVIIICNSMRVFGR